jgi:hypothetical protein
VAALPDRRRACRVRAVLPALRGTRVRRELGGGPPANHPVGQYPTPGRCATSSRSHFRDRVERRTRVMEARRRAAGTRRLLVLAAGTTVTAYAGSLVAVFWRAGR